MTGRGSRDDSNCVFSSGTSGKKHLGGNPQVSLPLALVLRAHRNLLWVHRFWEVVSPVKEVLGDQDMIKVKSLRDETSGHSCIEILNIHSQDCRFHVGNVSYRRERIPPPLEPQPHPHETRDQYVHSIYHFLVPFSSTVL